MQRSLIGVGPALRKARERRGVSVDEASRGTKIRADSLEALEEERFDDLLGEVYVRGALRSYASYLGLDPAKVLDAYSNAEGVQAAPAPEPPTQIRSAVGAARRRDNHRLAILVAIVLVVVAAGFGLLSNRNSAPVVSLPASPQSVEPAFAKVFVAVAAEHRVEVTVTIDDVEQPTATLEGGEARTFQGERLITLRLSRGGVAAVTANGTDFGVVGSQERPWRHTFASTSVASPTKPPEASPTEGAAPGSADTKGATTSPSA